MKNFISKYKSEIIVFVIFIVCTILFVTIGCIPSCSSDVRTETVATTIAATETTEKITEATETKATKKAKNKNQKKNNQDKPKDKVETTTNTIPATQPTTTKKIETKPKKNNSIFITAEAASTYPNASKIWEFLKKQGYNDYVCAGIMGNIMAEVGGQTLNIDPYLGNAYYGICQWGGGRRTRLINNYGSSLDAQLSFLAVELPEVISTGSSFYSMQNEQQAALYFAQYYERCSSSTYSIRQQNATKAYNYFVS